MEEPRKWIRIPPKDGKRGEGRWHVVNGDAMEKDFLRCKRTFELPVVWELHNQEIVKDGRGKTPNFLIQGLDMTHQFHEVATPIPVSNDRNTSLRFAQHQLMNLIKTVLVVEGDTNDTET